MHVNLNKTALYLISSLYALLRSSKAFIAIGLIMKEIRYFWGYGLNIILKIVGFYMLF